MRTITKEIAVRAPADTAYQVWRNLEGLPQFMEGVEEVREVSAERSHWKARGPVGSSAEWDADIVVDEPGRRLGWKSAEGSEVETEGLVQFLPEGEVTRVRVDLGYEAPGGAVGDAAARLFANPESQLESDLERFKEIMESGREFSGLDYTDASTPQTPAAVREQVKSVEHGTPGGTLGAPTPRELSQDESRFSEKGDGM